MKFRVLTTLGITLFPLATLMADPLYCPQNARYIDLGMTEDEVIAACGQPISKQDPNIPVMQKVPIKQLIYTTLNQGSVYPGLNSAFYNQWSLPSGSTGLSLEVDVVNNKVKSIKLNGSSSNAMSICGGQSVEVGDDVGKVYSACGSPSMINNSYMKVPIPSSSKPAVWTYQINADQPPMTLTFINGKLQSMH